MFILIIIEKNDDTNFSNDVYFSVSSQASEFDDEKSKSRGFSCSISDFIPGLKEYNSTEIAETAACHTHLLYMPFSKETDDIFYLKKLVSSLLNIIKFVR